MSPPQKKVLKSDGPAEQIVNEDAEFFSVEQKMKKDGWGSDYMVTDGDEEATDNQKIVHFLYGIEFCKGENKETRVLEIKKFLDGQAKSRMMDLLKQDSDVSQRPGDIELWRKVQAVVLRYTGREDAFTVFDGKNMPVALRSQKTKNCYQHATGGTVGYKIAFDKGDNENTVHTVDVAKAMRHYYNEDKLKRRVLGNKGGASLKLMEKLVFGTGLKIGANLPPDELGECDLKARMTTKGPALVSRFYTDEYLKKNRGDYVKEDGTFRLHQFDRVNDVDTHAFLELGAPDETEKNALQAMEEEGKKPVGTAPASIPDLSGSMSKDSLDGNAGLEGAGGLHAMICIGGRKDNSEKNWFLIQNTWTILPIFEASASYLAHHLSQREPNGRLVFLTGGLNASASEGTLPLVHQGLCLESSVGDDISEVYEEDEEDYNTDDLEE